MNVNVEATGAMSEWNLVEKKSGAKKRRRTSAIHKIGNEKEKPGFLSRHNHQNPIAVMLSPIRKRQEQVITRNLEIAGATTVQFQHSINEGNQSCISHLLVVTDDVSKAKSRISTSTYATCKATYVATKWATSILAAQTYLPTMSYDLERKQLCEQKSETESKRDKFPSNPSLPSLSTLLPVWCCNSVTGDSDLSEIELFLKRIPPFLCERCTITQSVYKAPNNELCSVLELVAKKRELEQSGGSEECAHIRARAYRRASAALKCVPFKIQSVQQAKALHSFGPRVLTVVNEYLMSGSAKEVREMSANERLGALAELKEMYGVGLASARKYYDDWKIMNVQQLEESVRGDKERENSGLQKYMRHYKNITRLTWNDGHAVKDILAHIANDCGEKALHLQFKLCGSFRRGERSGHDVDILYCRKQQYSHDHSSVLKEVLGRMRKYGLVIEVLRESSDVNGWNEMNYGRSEGRRAIYAYAHDVLHAIAQQNGVVFRLDVIGVRDASEFCFATLAWSGSTLFQRDMRMWCNEKKGWLLNQHGLFEVRTGKRVELEAKVGSEMDIFAAIGVTYRAPFERSC